LVREEVSIPFRLFVMSFGVLNIHLHGQYVSDAVRVRE
jgi:hypothetical protein